MNAREGLPAFFSGETPSRHSKTGMPAMRHAGFLVWEHSFSAGFLLVTGVTGVKGRGT
jgi:hypothetical protein